MTVLLALLGAVLVVSGCASAPPAPPPSPFPPRPKTLDLSNVDLCATLTPQQKQERGIDKERTVTATVDGEPTPTCGWTDEQGASYAVQVLASSAAVSLRGTPGARVVQISGYGAVRGPNENPIMLPESRSFCQIPIDTSDDRSLRVQYTSRDGYAVNPADQQAACAEATRLAADIIDNLMR